MSDYVPISAQIKVVEAPKPVEEKVHHDFTNIAVNIIHEQTLKETKKDIWSNSPYRELVKLQANNAGIVGERFISSICNATNIPACCDGCKTKKLGGGNGDGTIMDIAVEIKTSHQGSTYPSFQHELGEHPWRAQYMIFVDFSPNCIYLTIFRNFTEDIYKSKKKLVCFPTKSVTWRKKSGSFKLDTSVKINTWSVKQGNAVKITSETSNNEIASFIKRTIINT